MNYVESLKAIPSPLYKVKVFLIGSKVRKIRIEKEKDKEKKERTVDTLISMYGLEKYKNVGAIKKDVKEAEAKYDDLTKAYEKEIVEGYIINGINQYQSLSKMPNQRLVEYGEILGAFLVGNDLKTNQIRKFLDGIRQLENKINKDMRNEAFSNEELILLKVQLVYAAAREKRVEPFKKVINAAIDRVSASGKEGYDDFRKLVKLIEAVIAFHKYYGGED